jgi:hypothetical protein
MTDFSPAAKGKIAGANIQTVVHGGEHCGGQKWDRPRIMKQDKGTCNDCVGILLFQRFRQGEAKDRLGFG